jgi:P4 family phage/plasmid primase-like protien
MATGNSNAANLRILKKLLMTPEKFRETNYQDKACFSYSYNKYGAFDCWTSAISVLNNLPVTENICNELIIAPQKCKGYLDIEWLRDEFPELEPFQVRDDIKTLLVEIFRDDFQYELSPNNIYFASCHRPKNDRYKYSYHVVISTHPAIVFNNANEASFLAYRLREKCSDYFDPSIVDTSVYKKTQNIRMVYHCKVDEQFPFIPETGVNIMEYLITNIEVNHIILRSSEQHDNLYKTIKNVKNNFEDIPDNTLEEIRRKVKTLHPTSDEGNFSNGFIQFNYTDRREPCFCHDEKEVFHDQIGFFVYVFNNLICAGCHSGNCVDDKNKKIIKVLGNVTCTKDLTFEKVDFDNTFEIEHGLIEDCINNGAIGLSNLFQKMYLEPKRIKWVNDTKNGISYFWDGKLWEEDDYSFIERLLVTTVVRVLRKYKALSSNSDLESSNTEENIALAQKLITKLNDGMMLQSILKFVKPLIRDTEFSRIKDIHPNFLSCKNGMLDLVSGEIRPAVPEDNITKCIDTKYNADADCSDFDNFVKQITSNEEGSNEELYNYLKWCIGYALQGNPKKKMFMLLYGPYGFNGKSLLLNTISDVLKYYAVAMDSSVVLESPKKTAGSHSTELCQLENCRFGILSDTKEDATIDDGQMKQLTGITDKLSVREIFGKQREFKPVFVPFISTNHPVQINLSDKAMLERLVLLPFSLSFVDNPVQSYERQNDSSLAEKFAKNKEGILKWLVQASIYYHEDENKLAPDCIKEAKIKYNKEVNMFMNFIDKNFSKEENVAPIAKAKMLDYFRSFAIAEGIRCAQSKVEKELDRFIPFEIIGDAKYYTGYRYISPEIEQEDDLS